MKNKECLIQVLCMHNGSRRESRRSWGMWKRLTVKFYDDAVV